MLDALVKYCSMPAHINPGLNLKSVTGTGEIRLSQLLAWMQSEGILLVIIEGPRIQNDGTIRLQLVDGAEIFLEDDGSVASFDYLAEVIQRNFINRRKLASLRSSGGRITARRFVR